MPQAALNFPFARKPNLPARVDLAHPRAHGLAAFLIYPARNGFYNAVTGEVTTNNRGTVNAATMKATGEGRALHMPGTNILQITKPRNPLGATPSAKGGAVIARMRHLAHPSGNAFAAQYGNSTDGQGPYVGFNSSGNAVGGIWCSNGLAGGSDSTDWVNKWVTIGATTPVPTDNVDGLLFVNGVQRASGNNTHLNSTVAFNRLQIGGDGGSYEPAINVDIAWVAAFNRTLSDAEMAWWYRHPFAVLQQARNASFYSLPSAGGGASTIVFRKTLSPVGTRVGSRQMHSYR
jgi:hypothetical protein